MLVTLTSQRHLAIPSTDPNKVVAEIGAGKKAYISQCLTLDCVRRSQIRQVHRGIRDLLSDTAVSIRSQARPGDGFVQQPTTDDCAIHTLRNCLDLIVHGKVRQHTLDASKYRYKFAEGVLTEIKKAIGRVSADEPLDGTRRLRL